MKKRLFIFDMGGVMCTNTNVVESICKELNLNKREFFDFVKSENFVKIQSGKLSMKAFWQEFSERSGIDVKEDYFETKFDPKRNEEMYQLVNQLKENNRVVAGTNTIDSHYKKHRKNGDYDVFEAVYPSNLIGIAKPDEDFYRIILEKENRQPEETVFIDDNIENVESAAKLGITAIHFTSYEDLKEKLKKL
jgi:putative hydrolase of the HAD superfamily